MKNICFLIGNLNNSGGTERVTSIIANELANSGYNITILSLVEGLEPFFKLSENIKIYSLYSKKISFKKKLLTTVLKIRNFIKCHNIDTLVVVDTISCLFTVPALLGTKVNHIGWEHFNFNSDLGKKERRFTRQLAAHYCDAVVTLTQRDKYYWLEKTNGKANIISIPNPSPFDIQSQHDLPNNKTILAVGRLVHIKGFDLLLQAWRSVAPLFPDWRLVIVGEGEEKAQLAKYIAQHQLHNSVELVGRTNDVAKYYQRADIYCLSSRFEGFPMVLLEAISFGLPVVSFDCDTGPAEILEGTGSILVPKNDIDKFASSLMSLMENDERRNNISIDSKSKAEMYQSKNIINSWIMLFESF